MKCGKTQQELNKINVPEQFPVEKNLREADNLNKKQTFPSPPLLAMAYGSSYSLQHESSLPEVEKILRFSGYHALFLHTFINIH